jgi:HK97 family phage prohead protease
MEAPRNDLYRSTPPMEVRASEDGRLTLFGHFSVFDTPTEINSTYEGRFIERIAPGAFKKSLAERGQHMKIMWNHGRTEVLPDVLIAKPKVVTEDARGAYYEAEMFSGLPEWLYEGLREGVYGASFRFETIRDLWDDDPTRSESNPEGLPERTVTEAKVSEAGPVSWPAYPDATAGVRSLSDRYIDLRTLTDRAALEAPGPISAAPIPTTDAGSAHLGGPTPQERRLRALELRGVLLP